MGFVSSDRITTGYLPQERGKEQTSFYKNLAINLLKLEQTQRGLLTYNFNQETVKGAPDRLDLSRLSESSAAFAISLRKCANAKCLSEGQRIHSHIIQIGYQQDIVLSNLLVHLYGKCGVIEDARALFLEIQERDVFSWTFMIGTYAQHGQGKEALYLFLQMKLDAVLPNKFTFIAVLSACANRSALSQGKYIHGQIVAIGVESDVFVGNALINMYAKGDSLDGAREIFKTMPERDLVSWNTMLTACIQHGENKEALQLFKQMQCEELIPDKVTCISILEAFSGQETLAEAKKFHYYITSQGFESDVAVGTAIVDMYGRCGGPDKAQIMFNKMLTRNVISWTVMISVYVQHGKCNEALQLFTQMQLEGTLPNKFTHITILSACANQQAFADGQQMHVRILANRFELDIVAQTALVNMYGKCGCLEKAERMFVRMQERSVVSFNAMIAVYSLHGQDKRAFQLYEKMLIEGLIPSTITFINILEGCANQSSLAEGKQLHAIIVDIGLESDVVVGTSLVNMYSKCGSLQGALAVFDALHQRSLISWNTMIATYAQHGMGKEALQALQQMQHEGMMPSKVTFVSILSACSHSGLVHEGCHHFLSINKSHLIEPSMEHYECMVDLLSRAGHLDEGEEFITKMPFLPTTMSWLTLLSACRTHFDAERGERAFEIEPGNETPYLMLSKIYAGSGKWNHAGKMRHWLRSEGLSKRS